MKGKVSSLVRSEGGLTRGVKGKACASHLGSGSRSILRLATIGLTEESEACQMSSYTLGRGVPEVEGCCCVGPSS